MDYSKYNNCLRLQITMDSNFEDRLNSLVKHCLKYGFNNVMLMLNTEEFFDGHITCMSEKASHLYALGNRSEQSSVTVCAVRTEEPLSRWKKSLPSLVKSGASPFTIL
mgnify:CR=1 FL=1